MPQIQTTAAGLIWYKTLVVQFGRGAACSGGGGQLLTQPKQGPHCNLQAGNLGLDETRIANPKLNMKFLKLQKKLREKYIEIKIYEKSKNLRKREAQAQSTKKT